MAFQANRNKMQAGIAILISERLQNKLIRQNKKEHYISIKEKNPPREKNYHYRHTPRYTEANRIKQRGQVMFPKSHSKLRRKYSRPVRNTVSKKVINNLELIDTGKDLLNRSPVTQALRLTVIKWDLMNLKSFCMPLYSKGHHRQHNTPGQAHVQE